MIELYKTVFLLVDRYDIMSVNLERMWKEELKLFLYKTDVMVRATIQVETSRLVDIYFYD
jgi:hypothetical protein